MNLLRNLSIGGKIVFVVAIVIALQLGVAIVGLHSLGTVKESLDHAISVDAEKIILVQEIKSYLIRMQRAEKNLILSDTEEQLNHHAANILKHRENIEDRLAQLRPLVCDDEEVKLFKSFEWDYQAFAKANAEVRSIILDGWQPAIGPDGIPEGTRPENLKAAIHISKGEARTTFDRAEEAILALIAVIKEELAEDQVSADRQYRTALSTKIALLAISVGAGLTFGLLVAQGIVRGLKGLLDVADAIAAGKLDTVVAVRSTDEVGKLASAVGKMQGILRQADKESAAQDWLKTGLGRLNNVMRGEPDIAKLSTQVISEIATYLDAKVAALYLLDEQPGVEQLRLVGTYAYTKRKNLSNLFKIGEGLVGQAAFEKQQILVRNVPEDYIRVTSGLGERTPKFICVTPFLFEDRLKGVIEVGTLNHMTDLELEYLGQAVPALGVTIEAAQRRTEVDRALQQSQRLSEELQAQQEELKTANEELEEQTRLLQQSEERLKAQQEELQVVNEELEEKNESLDRQRREVERARRDIADKAEQLAIASRYKSEFLANMSHELRTPLNSLLLLARSFAVNTDGNLTGDQVESAHVIYNSGNDLLALINEILDLSKIEAGRMDLHIESVQTRAMADTIREGFQHVADDKGLELDVRLDENAPREIVTDEKRVEQVIRNLMSNAIKFTEQGRVTLRFGRPGGDADLSTSGLAPGNALAIAVSDTGIGMSPEQQKVVFEAFQQAEGGTARKYGGTGLGLSISRELARLLGGEIQLQSVPGEGSTFVLYLPLAILAAEETTSATSSETTAAKTNERRVLVKREEPVIDQIDDDRHQLEPGDKVILIIDDDPNFAKVLMDICRNKGFKVLASASGERGLVTAQEHLPAAIILDIRLPGMDGWTVLDALKDNPATRHIPVHIISVEEATMEALRKGAVGFLTKPVAQEDLADALQKLESTSSTDVKELLVVEDDEGLREHIVSLLANGHVRADEAHTGAEAIRAIESKEYHCMILDLGLPDISGFDLLKDLEKKDITIPPVIVYTGRELTREEEMTLRNYTESIIIKDVRSDERLLDEVSLFLHQVVREMPESKRQIITNLHDTDALLVGKNVLIVDDDMRALFALSRLLTDKGMTPLKAENGEKALRLLNQAGDIDLVLMDIMMPVMDGYETMKRIREDDRFRSLAIIALTAKAMKGDEKRCIAAGANDYLPKPVDPDRLCAMMRVWLYR